MRHTITLSGPTGTKILTISGAGTASATVAAGLWNIGVDAYYGEELYAVGSASADVKAGRTTNVSVQMTVVWTEEISTYYVEDGTAAHPFRVYNVATLQKVGTGTDGWDLDKHYMMTQDITFDLTPVRTSNFTPIGDDVTPFTGSFNGNGRKIVNLVIDEPTLYLQGLFGCISGDGTATGIVKNLGLVGGSIEGFNLVGGVVGWNGGTLTNNYGWDLMPMREQRREKMKKNNYMIRSIFIFGLFTILLISCVSTQRPFNEVYTGEFTFLLRNTKWELFDHKSGDNLSFYVVFNADGTVSWYNIPDRYNAILSENSTWERSGDDLIFNASNGFYLYEGKINFMDGQKTINGRYKTGYTKPIKSHPTGDFSMIEQ